MPSTTSPTSAAAGAGAGTTVATPSTNLPSTQDHALPTILPPPTPQSILAALPAPQIFDFVPQIQALISRLLLDPAVDKDALQAKELGDEIAGIRRQIGAARGVIAGVQDVNRTVAEQGEEIERIKGRVEGLRGLIVGLGEGCGVAEGDDAR